MTEAIFQQFEENLKTIKGNLKNHQLTNATQFERSYDESLSSSRYVQRISQKRSQDYAKDIINTENKISSLAESIKTSEKQLNELDIKMKKIKSSTVLKSLRTEFDAINATKKMQSNEKRILENQLFSFKTNKATSDTRMQEAKNQIDNLEKPMAPNQNVRSRSGGMDEYVKRERSLPTEERPDEDRKRSPATTNDLTRHRR